MKKTVLGVLCATIAGISWGFSGTCGEYIMQYKNMDPYVLTSIRMCIAGAVLTVASLLFCKESVKKLFHTPRDLKRVVVFSLLGIIFSQITYMKSIVYSNAATGTVLQYVGLIMVMAVSCVLLRKWPDIKQLFALFLCAIGIFLSATHGSLTSLAISPLALAWGLASAVSLVIYTMYPEGILNRYGSVPVTGLAMLFGGVILLPVARPWQAGFVKDTGCFLALGSVIVFGTLLSYTLYMQGIKMIGSVKTSMCACMEPVSATFFCAVWLGAKFTGMDFAGFAAVIGAVLMLSLPTPKRFRTERN